MPDESADNPKQPEDKSPTPTESELDAAQQAEAQADAAQAGSADAPKPAPLKPSSETKPAPDPATDKKHWWQRKKERPEPTTPGGKLWHNWVKPIGIVIIIVVLLRSTLIDWNDVPTGSMEQEIQVGDRILVNRLSYAFQFPLTGPTIGVPFTPLQWKNPLDGIGQIQWAQPDRGDIVTFWKPHPVPQERVRMVKRIVAVPGDTIAMNGGVMTINGEAASYTDITPPTPRQTKYNVQGPLGKPVAVYDDLEDMEEQLMGETRKVQHIKKRWLKDAQIVEFATGERLLVDQGYITDGYKRGEPILDFLAKRGNPSFNIIATVKNGTTQLDGETVTSNAFCAELLKRYTTGDTADLLKKLGLGIDEHQLTIDGEPVPIERLKIRYEAAFKKLSEGDKNTLAPFTNTLQYIQHTYMTSFGPIKLGEDEYFMVGDNRNNSHDSRYFGPVDRGEITGKAFAIAFSFKDNKILTIPPRPDWSRWFKDLD